MRAHQLFGLALRLLVRVPEALAHVQFVLANEARALAGDVRGAHVDEALQRAAGVRGLRQREHVARPARR